VQIVINAAYLERSCEWLDQYVSRVVGSSATQPQVAAAPITAGVTATGGTPHLVPLKDDVFRVRRSTLVTIMRVFRTFGLKPSNVLMKECARKSMNSCNWVCSLW
jgi:hypothetical protein